MKRSLHNTFWAAIALSLAMHFFVALGVWLYPGKAPELQKKSIEISLIEPTGQKKLRQVVQQNKKAVNDEVPEDAKYLGRHNQQVKKQTRAEKSGKYRNTGGKGGQSQKPKSATKPRASQKLRPKGQLPSLADLKPDFKPEPVVDSKDYSAQGGRPTSQTDDHLKDVEKGLQTLLSTREFVFYSYYERIREKIRQHWEPSIREKVRKIFAQGRNIASTGNQITRVLIILDNKGSLVDVKVISKSGYRDIDDAALDAFRAAEPFPNPPKGIVENDGTIKIRWDFVLEA